MRMVTPRFLLALIIGLTFVSPVFAQDAPASAAPASSPATAPATTSPDPASAAPTSADPAPVPASAPAQSAASLPQAATNLNDVLDRVVQREHFFMAQMRHMHPMVETYLQDLKDDHAGN